MKKPRTGRAGGVTPGYCKDKEGEVLEGPEVSRDAALGGPHETAISAPGVRDQQPPWTSAARLCAGPRKSLAVDGRSHWLQFLRVHRAVDLFLVSRLPRGRNSEDQLSKVAS
jgi:hypothetical protein